MVFKTELIDNLNKLFNDKRKTFNFVGYVNVIYGKNIKIYNIQEEIKIAIKQYTDNYIKNMRKNIIAKCNSNSDIIIKQCSGTKYNCLLRTLTISSNKKTSNTIILRNHNMFNMYVFIK